MQSGYFLGKIYYKNQEELIEKYKLDIITYNNATKRYDKITLHYTVFLEDNIVLIKELIIQKNLNEKNYNEKNYYNITTKAKFIIDYINEVE